MRVCSINITNEKTSKSKFINIITEMMKIISFLLITFLPSSLSSLHKLSFSNAIEAKSAISKGERFLFQNNLDFIAIDFTFQLMIFF